MPAWRGAAPFPSWSQILGGHRHSFRLYLAMAHRVAGCSPEPCRRGREGRGRHHPRPERFSTGCGYTRTTQPATRSTALPGSGIRASRWIARSAPSPSGTTGSSTSAATGPKQPPLEAGTDGIQGRLRSWCGSDLDGRARRHIQEGLATLDPQRSDRRPLRPRSGREYEAAGEGDASRSDSSSRSS